MEGAVQKRALEESILSHGMLHLRHLYGLLQMLLAQGRVARSDVLDLGGPDVILSSAGEVPSGNGDELGSENEASEVLLPADLLRRHARHARVAHQRRDNLVAIYPVRGADEQVLQGAAVVFAAGRE